MTMFALHDVQPLLQLMLLTICWMSRFQGIDPSQWVHGLFAPLASCIFQIIQFEWFAKTPFILEFTHISWMLLSTTTRSSWFPPFGCGAMGHADRRKGRMDSHLRSCCRCRQQRPQRKAENRSKQQILQENTVYKCACCVCMCICISVHICLVILIENVQKRAAEQELFSKMACCEHRDLSTILPSWCFLPRNLQVFLPAWE